MICKISAGAGTMGVARQQAGVSPPAHSPMHTGKAQPHGLKGEPVASGDCCGFLWRSGTGEQRAR